MRFFAETATLAGKRGLAILGAATTVFPVGAYALSRNAAVAVAFLLGFLLLAALLAAHGFWAETKDAEDKLRSVEDTPEFKIDAVLRRALEVREDLTHRDESEKARRLKTMELIAATIMVVGEYAPAYADDLKTREIQGGAGRERFLAVVNEYYGVLAAVRKQL